MSEHAQTETEVDPEAGETLRVPSVESRSQVHSDDGEPISDEMASAAAVAAVVAIRQVARLRGQSGRGRRRARDEEERPCGLQRPSPQCAQASAPDLDPDAEALNRCWTR